MEVLVANVDHIKFDIDYALEEQYGALPLPFPGMDSKYFILFSFKIPQLSPPEDVRVKSTGILALSITPCGVVTLGS